MATPASVLTIVTAAELRELLGSSDPPLLIEARSATDPAPSAVIPGAVAFSLASIDVYEEDHARLGWPQIRSGNYSLKPPAEVRSALEAAGITHLRRTVVYTQSAKAGGHDVAVAARLAWALSFAGVAHVSLLPRGLWPYETAAQYSPPHPVADFFEGAPTLPFPLHPEFVASTAQVEHAVAAGGCGPGAVLADVRSWREFCGGAHDYPFPMPLGRIPHARWAHWGPATYVGGDLFVHETGQMQPLASIVGLWREWGLELGGSERIIFYCGSGWRSAVGWCLARIMHHADCANYDGGFLEWSMLDERADAHPIERGNLVGCDSAAARGEDSRGAAESAEHLMPASAPRVNA